MHSENIIQGRHYTNNPCLIPINWTDWCNCRNSGIIDEIIWLHHIITIYVSFIGYCMVKKITLFYYTVFRRIS